MNYIKKHWDDNAITFKTSNQASWGDIYAIELEIDAIGALINDNSDVLDVGCANGYSTIKQWGNKKLNSITGVDYSEHMINYAEENKKINLLENSPVFFKVADIKKLPFADNSFDVVYTTRVLINLPTWEEQISAIQECLRVTKTGGKVLFSEAFWEPLCKLNTIRHIFGLKPLIEHDFNRYIKFDYLDQYLKSCSLDFKRYDFSSLYYLGSRVFRELVTDFDQFEGYSNPINKAFFDIEKMYSGGEIGIQQLIEIYK